MLFAPIIKIIFDISTSNNIKNSNIYAKIAGNGYQTRGTINIYHKFIEPVIIHFLAIKYVETVVNE